MKILVTGITGQLGFDVMTELHNRNIEAIGAARKDFDLNDKTSIKKFITKHSPDAVIHCAAYTAVDKAEDEPEVAMQVNGRATEVIAEVCKNIAPSSPQYIPSLDKLGVFTLKPENTYLSE